MIYEGGPVVDFDKNVPNSSWTLKVVTVKPSDFTETDDASKDLDIVSNNSVISSFDSMWRYISTSDDEQDRWPNLQGQKEILATDQRWVWKHLRNISKFEEWKYERLCDLVLVDIILEI